MHMTLLVSELSAYPRGKVGPIRTTPLIPNQFFLESTCIFTEAPRPLIATWRNKMTTLLAGSMNISVVYG